MDTLAELATAAAEHYVKREFLEPRRAPAPACAKTYLSFW